MKKSHAQRLTKYEPITELKQIGLARTKKLEYSVLKTGAQFCDALPYLDEYFTTDPNTPFHHMMIVSLTNVDFPNSNGGAPKELPLYKKPKLTVVATCKKARTTIFEALHDKNVEESYDLKVISSENEDKISLEDQVTSLYTEEQLARIRTTSKVKDTEDVMNESMEMFQTGQKRRRDSEKAGDSNDGEFYEEQLI